MKKLFSLVLTLFFTLNLLASDIELTQKEKEWLKNHPIITLGTEEKWTPFVINKGNSLSGFDIDILNLINKNTGANFQLKVGTWKDMVQKAINKEIDGLSTSAVHEERAKFFNFSNSYTSTKKYLITLNNNPKNINSIDDLVGKKIGYLEKNLFDKKLISQYKESILVPLKSLDEILHNLITGKIDATIGNNEIFTMAEKERLPYLKIIDKVQNSTLNLVFSIRKDYPEAISILNKGLESIPEDTKKYISKKWFAVPQNIEEKNNLNLTKEENEYLKNKKVLTVANLKTFPPFNFNEDNTPKGYSIDYMRLVGKYLNIDIEFITNKPWNEFMIMLKDKNIDLIPHVAITEERQKYLDFTNFNHIEYTTGVAIDKNSNVKSMDDLKDKVIAVAKKTFIESYLKNNFPEQKLLFSSSTAKAVEDVSMGQASAVVGSLPALQYYIQKDWLSNVKTTILNDLGLEEKTALPMAVSKGNLLLKSILEKVNDVIPHNEKVKLKHKWMNLSDLNYSLNNEEIKYLKKKKIIKMCVLPDWLPFEQIDNNGNHKGIGADLMKIISKYLDTPIKLVATKQWSESLQNIRDRKCDILPVAMDVASRRDAMNFTKPYVAEPFVIATKADKLFIKDSNALSNKKVGIVKSYAFIDVLKQRNPLIQIVDVENTKEGLERVSSGELFGYIDTMPTIGYGIQKYSMFDLKIAGRLEFDIKLSIASRNDEPLLNTIMQKALDEISEEQKRTIVNKWIEIKVAQEVNYTLLWQTSLVFAIIVLIILYKNRTVHLLNKDLTKAKNEIEEQQSMVNKYVLILTTDTNGIITEANEAYCKAVGYTKDELYGKKHTNMRHPDIDDNFFINLWETISKNKTWSGEIKNLRKDGETIWLNMYIEPIFKDNIKIGYRAISENITDKKRIEELSVTDKLTGLYNRMKLDEIMLIKVEEFKRYEAKFSIILLDIDDFKIVNDTYGHDVGDYVLKEIAKTLKINLRISDIVARWGGEEFLIICENTSLSDAKIVAENIRKHIENIKFDIIGKETISLGVVEFRDSDTLNTIFKRADDALYEAKKTGKNRTVVM
ncbi:MAG: transporter substrate-binding domain-containing protein [Arcobacter sp.]|uniref:transporter substrate-binding domain-containing protein n=1 Tax=Arcobacter sp. TaxID=1872629 RepID=UPI003AFFC7E2